MIRSLIRDNHSRWTTLTVVALLVTAAFFRFPELGSLGFYGDEETTALAARSVAEGNGFKMPSGLQYYRAAPLTFLNAIVAKAMGAENELAYRIPAAVLGVLTPAVLFLMARTIVPSGIALAAAVLLAISDWHVLTSREARMYAAFMLCFMASGLAIWHWAQNLDVKRYLTIALILLTTLSLHSLGLLALVFPLVWLCFQSDADVPWIRLSILGVLFVAYFLLVDQLVVSGAYASFQQSSGLGLETRSVSPGHQASVPITEWGRMAIPWLTGGILGLWLGRRVSADHNVQISWMNSAAIVLACTIAGAAFVALHFYGAGLAAVTALLLYQGEPKNALKKAYLLFVLLAVAAAGHFLLRHGITITAAEFRNFFLFPYPYFTYFWQYSPGLLLLFGIGVGILVIDRPNRSVNSLRAAALVVIGIVTAIGVAMKYGGMRYLIGMYPFMLLVAAYPLYRVYQVGQRRGQLPGTLVATVLAAFVIMGALGGHGIGAAANARNISYGAAASAQTLGFPIYPDHKGAGEYVKKFVGTEDIIVAADALQQFWYVGRVDYWLNDPASISRFSYTDRQGMQRDIYVNSRPLVSPTQELLCPGSNSRIWVITSAEKAHHPDRNLSEEQGEWLRAIESNSRPVYTGRDGVTKVYRVQCG